MHNIRSVIGYWPVLRRSMHYSLANIQAKTLLRAARHEGTYGASPTKYSMAFPGKCNGRRSCSLLGIPSMGLRKFSDVASPADAGEQKLENILKQKFPNATRIQVTDISGGCGSMYEVHVESKDFSGLRTVAQHKLITNALKAEVGQMHGLRVFTTVPE